MSYSLGTTLRNQPVTLVYEFDREGDFTTWQVLYKDVDVDPVLTLQDTNDLMREARRHHKELMATYYPQEGDE